MVKRNIFETEVKTDKTAGGFSVRNGFSSDKVLIILKGVELKLVRVGKN